MISQLIFNILDFLKMLLIDAPTVIIKVIFFKEEGYSMKIIPRALFSEHPFLTTLTIIAIVFLVGGTYRHIEDQFYQAHPDSAYLEWCEKVGDNVLTAQDRVFHIAERYDKHLTHPGKLKRLYLDIFDTPTYKAQRRHRHELNLKLIQQRKEREQIKAEKKALRDSIRATKELNK